MTHYSRRVGQERVECAAAGDICVQIAEFRRDDRTKLKLQVRTFNGARYVDLRIHERGDDGASIPTVRGLTLRPSELDSVLAALERAKHILRSKPNEERK